MFLCEPGKECHQPRQGGNGTSVDAKVNRTLNQRLNMESLTRLCSLREIFSFLRNENPGRLREWLEKEFEKSA